MKRFSGYEDVKERDFNSYEKLELGGHICKILDVKIETIQGKTGPFEQLVIRFDTDDSDKQPQFYSKKFKNDADKDALNAKWKGYYRLSCPADKDDSEQNERAKVNFKTFITSIEKSNNGYDWEKANWEEKTLIGKKFVGVFGIEEFEGTTGIAWVAKCKFIRSTETDLEKVTIPKVRLVDGSYMDYEDWLEAKEEQKGKEKENNAEFSVDEDSDSDLPF